MAAERFDTFTRSLSATSSRRWVLGGLASTLGAFVPPPWSSEVAARKKHRRKHKRKRKTTILPDDCLTGQVSCNGQCRLPDLATCVDHAECCSSHCLLGVCYPSCQAKACSQDEDCCDGVFCELGRCGGCVGWGGSCPFGDECCYSACNLVEVGGGQVRNICGSVLGEPCVTVRDCLSGFCRSGRCCLTECCADTDCSPAEVCRGGECQPIIGG
jgi:hypothetical protein